ncbi:MAG: hypothetical protein JJ975_14945 [Bacteroidia bacterium]|nr:hypothetical protein [Bacteroidia bacterium]
MKTTVKLFAWLSLCTMLIACNQANHSNEKTTVTTQEKEAKFLRTKPSTSLAVGCQSDVFDVAKGAQINYETGAKVIVPENAFVDEDGNPVTGEVKLEFTELNDAASIIASGIPMCIEIDGKTEYMESGGMFEINAKQQGKKLKLASGKHIEVQTMNNKPGDFNFYTFNAEEGKWVEQNKSSLNAVSQPNTTSTTTASDVVSTTTTKPVPVPAKPRKASSDDEVFEIRVTNMADYGMHAWDNVMWTFADQTSNSEENDWLYASRWDDITITNYDMRKAIYNVKAERRVRKDGSTTPITRNTPSEDIKTIYKTVAVTPVLFGQDYDDAVKNYNKALKKYEAYQEKKENEKKSQEAQAAFVRTVSIQGLGVHNWDRILKQRETLVLNAEYSVPTLYEDKDIPVVYMITGDQREVITFYQSSAGNLAFNPTYPNTLLAILPNNEVAFLKTGEISPTKLRNAKRTKEIEIGLKPSGVFVNSTEDLSKFIANNS